MDTDKPLSELRKVFTKFPQVVINMKVKNQTGVGDVARCHALVKDAEKTLGDSGRVLLRYSGTEPKPVSSSKAVTKSRSKLLPTVLRKDSPEIGA